MQSYLETLDQFTTFLVAAGMPTKLDRLTRDHIETWFAELRDAGRAAATLRLRYASLRQFFRFCAEEGEITESPMRNMKAPLVPEQPVDSPRGVVWRNATTEPRQDLVQLHIAMRETRKLRACIAANDRGLDCERQ